MLVISALFSNAYAQSNVTSSGISIQGIARDETNAAIANIDQLGLSFMIYSFGTGNSEQPILTRTANVRTDNFGVFSYVLEIDQSLYNQIGSRTTYLKVSQGAVVFSNEKLQAVPYSIYAQNGVPTGAIMPFIGTTAPIGWLLCDGSAIADNATNAALRALLGSNNTPDLRAMFLRGAGTGNGRTGPALKTVQQDDIIAHLHAISLVTNIMGDHAHTTAFSNDDWNSSGGTNTNGTARDSNTNPNNHTLPTNVAGAHSHTVNGNSANTGGTETRPINYGVNYIIKI